VTLGNTWREVLHLNYTRYRHLMSSARSNFQDYEWSELSWLTCVFGLDCPGGAGIIRPQGRSWCRRPVGDRIRLHTRPHCGIQRSFSVVWERCQATGRKAVPQGVSQLQPPEAIGHPAPPGLQKGLLEDLITVTFFPPPLCVLIETLPEAQAEYCSVDTCLSKLRL